MAPLENNISILVIEDNPGDQLLLEANLEETNLPIAKITMAGTITDAIAFLQREEFSLIFLDFFLPDSGGLNSYIQIAKINSKIPVILLSGLLDTELSLKTISLGAQDFLVKGSFDSQMLEKAARYSIERKKNIELLKENNERYDIISKATNDIIWDWNLITDKVKWIGQGLKNYLPFNFDEEYIPDNFWTAGLHKDERKSIIESVQKAIVTGENSWESDYRFLRTDSTYAHIYSRGYILKNEEQKAIRMIGSMQDITERKNAEIETEKARIAAEQARKTQEEFLANMSHEIRTPMNGVIGMTDLLTGTELNKVQKEYVETIRESASNLMVIINDILDLTKIVSGKIKIEKSDFNLNELIDNIIKINMFRANEKAILLKSDIDKNIPVFLSGDPGRLNQILINLIGNAIKFTEVGEVNLAIKLLTRDEQNVSLEFIVKDTGIGIEKDMIENIFERFTQVSADSKRKYGGTGLGLTITKQLIELQGGTIQVISERFKGSVFTFYLNFQKSINPQKDIKNKQVLFPTLRLDDSRILLVDDNFINQKVVVKCLTNQGACVEVANNGKEAIDMLLKKEYHLVIMDLQMPVMDGYEATKIIRTELSKQITNIPIIAMTASALISDKAKCLSSGMNDYIAKPFQAKDLYEKIIAQLEKSLRQA